MYESPEGERPLLPSEQLERPLRPAWFATFAHVLPFPSPNPGRAGSEVSTSLVAMPIRGGRVCVWNPDSVSKHRPVPPVAFRAGSEVEKQEKAQALALALAAAPPPIARPPPPPQAILPPRRPFVPGEVIDVDMSDDDAAAEVEVKSQLIHSAVPPPCASAPRLPVALSPSERASRLTSPPLLSNPQRPPQSRPRSGPGGSRPSPTRSSTTSATATRRRS